MASAALSSSIFSPTFTGRYVKMVPASVRCTPSTRMSLMTKGSKASAGTAMAAAHAMRRRRRRVRGRVKGSAGEEAVDVVVEREDREPDEKRESEALTDLHRTFRHRAALHDFGEIIHQVPPVEERDRQEIEHAEAHAHEIGRASCR